MSHVLSLELLALTPSEVGNSTGKVGNVMPEPFWMPIGDERLPGAFFARTRLATPTEARVNKRTALAIDSNNPNDRAHTIVEVPVEETKLVSRLLREVTNRTHECTENGEASDDPVPELGETGYSIHNGGDTFAFRYGNDAAYHARHVQYRIAAFPNS